MNVTEVQTCALTIIKKQKEEGEATADGNATIEGGATLVMSPSHQPTEFTHTVCVGMVKALSTKASPTLLQKCE